MCITFLDNYIIRSYRDVIVVTNTATRRTTFQCKLFKQYCCSFHGSNLWLLTSKRCYDICVAWRRALRKLWNVPYRTHNKILAILSNNLPLEMNLDKRFIKLSNNVLNHSTGIIKSVASLSLYNPSSTFNRNNNYVCQMYGSSINASSVFKVWYDSISDVERADVSVLDDN